jgi:preprotein translocase subunit SecA
VNNEGLSQTNQISETIGHLSTVSRNAINFVVQLILAGSKNKELAELRSIAMQIDELKESMNDLTDEELSEKTLYFKQLLKEGKTLDDILVEAFAVIREAAKRVLKEEPYIVQLMGGIALHRGMLAEMKTGEGKTLVAILPAYLNSLTGLGVHIVTVNDYLAHRETEWMGRVFRFLGLTVGCIANDVPQSEKRAAYEADITYCTNNELGFDFLRDNMVEDISEKCQRGLNYCIVDEADSVLIDEARTPLIISGPTRDRSEGYQISDSIVSRLKPEHYSISMKEHRATFTDEGIDEVERMLQDGGIIEGDLYNHKNSVLLHQLGQALRAHHLYRIGIDYIIEDEETGYTMKPAVKIIDEHTGRILRGRRYSDGLHQALEAKEKVPVRSESETLASITFQRLFRMYKKLSGMTGTAMTEAEEFESTYYLRVIEIPTNKPIQRIDHDDQIYITKLEKIKGIVSLVERCHAKGQPVIVGSAHVESSEELADILDQAGFNIYLLNAKNHAREADVIANAGRVGAVTVVTNMAGRGTDIKLGGDIRVIVKRRTYGIEDPETIAREEENVRLEVEENKKKVLEAGGLFIIGVEHNNNRRIDNQLRGRSGRQGDPGESKFFMCAEDDLICKFNPNLGQMLRQFGAQEDEVLEHPWLTSAVYNAQKRMEAFNFEARQSLQKYADIKESYVIAFYKIRDDILTTAPDKRLSDIFEEVMNTPALLDRVDTELQTTREELRINFYNKMQAAKDNNDNIRRILLNSIDVNCRRYMMIMTNARDVVSFQSYTQRDPIMAYNKIATDKFYECVQNTKVEDVVNFMREGQTYEDMMEPFASLKEYLLSNTALFDLEGDTAKLEELKNEFKKVFNSSDEQNTEAPESDSDNSDSEDRK